MSDYTERTALIERAIATYSPSGQEDEIADLIFEELDNLGLSPNIDQAGNVIASIGSGEKSILLCGHMDTVPGELKVVSEDGFIHGRGACDAKGPLMSLLFAFEDYALNRQKNSSGRLIFAGVTEEERTSAGLKALIMENVRADYAIFGEPCGISKITIGYRGHLPTVVKIETEPVHASAPWRTINSAELAFSIYEKLRDDVWPKNRETNSVENVSVALTEIHGGSAHNVTPLMTEMTLDIRLPNGTTVSSAKALVESVLDSFRLKHKKAKISVLFDDPTEAYKVGLDSRLVRAVSRALLKSQKALKPSYIEKSGTGDMNTYASTFGVEAITYGPGDTKLSHTTEEKVSISEIMECSKILVLAIEELFGMK
ncbi:MAG: M20/M25/M40 family metallo-hydrolase [Nitrososphaerales archaeon]